VNKYTKMLAGQLLEHNINVNCIAPVRSRFTLCSTFASILGIVCTHGTQ
jgi:hypothetical protein